MLAEMLHIEGNTASLQLEALDCVANATLPMGYDDQQGSDPRSA